MENRTCGTCDYYMRHYTFNQRKIFRVYCGHCMYGRTKTKRPDGKACAFYREAQREDAFVSKEYLSKEILAYVMRLELLPEICDLEMELNSKISGK